jgi:uncharacterized repeat protein (TIGR01451 family)
MPTRARLHVTFLSVKSRRGLATVTVATVIGAAILPGPAPAAAGPAAFTLRYSSQGWADVTQTGSAALACPANAPACQDGSDPSAATVWVDVDQDPSTMNSSRAVLAIPPRASVDWVGLYWAGDLGIRGDGVAPGCDAAPEGAAPPTLPPAPDKANQLKLSVGDQPYAVITANSLTTVTGPGGGTGFQAYVDLTSLVRPAAAAPAPAQLTIAVADLQVASGPGCGGGWTAVLAYSYTDGPDRTYAPDFRSVAVFDGTLSAATGVEEQVRLDGLATASQDGKPRLLSSLFASGQALGQDALTLGSAKVPRSGKGVTGITGQPGPGYQRATSAVAPSAINPGATLGVTAVRAGFVTAVLGLSTPLPVKGNLSVVSEVNPTTVAVGSEATVTVTLHNDADLNASGVRVAVRLPDGLKLVAEVQDFDASTGVWSPGAVAAHGSSGLSLRVLVGDTGDLVSTAQITASDIPNQNPSGANSVTVTALPSAAPAPSKAAQAAVVTPEPWNRWEVTPAVLFGIGLFLLGLLLLSLAVVRHRARAY